MYGYLADAVVCVHVLYVAYVVLGQAAIVAAATFRRRWGRNPWFRWSHLLAILIVAVEEAVGWRCPLTVWEQQFRELAGQQFHGETFMSWLGHQLLFSKDLNCGWTPQTISAVNVAFAVVVVQGFLMYPPRWFRLARRELPRDPA